MNSYFKRKKSIRKKEIKKILAASNAHALPRLVGNQKNKSFKMVWFIFFLVSIGACVYFVYRTLRRSWLAISEYNIVSN